jgi:translation initiation factor 4G
MLYGLQKSDSDRENLCSLLLAGKEKGLISTENFVEGYTAVLEKLTELERDDVLAKSHVARFGAHAVSTGIVTLAELAPPLHGGAFYPLFLLCLQQLSKINDPEWLTKVFNESKINLPDMLPELNKEKMMDILEDRGLSFLFPLLRIQSELWKQLTADPNPVAFFKWIKDNVDARMHTDPGFIILLVTCIIRYITSETTMKDGSDLSVVPDKVAVDAEKQMLAKFKMVIQKFLLDKIDLHVTALYAIQVYAYNNNSPKGLILRLFSNLYDMDVIDEEAYIHWKEEVNELHPGKGKALFQVNQWLTWLEQASEESDDED